MTAMRFEAARTEAAGITKALTTTQSLLDIALKVDEGGIKAMKTVANFVGTTTTALLEIVAAFTRAMTGATNAAARRTAIAELTTAIGKLEISVKAQKALLAGIVATKGR